MEKRIQLIAIAVLAVFVGAAGLWYTGFLTFSAGIPHLSFGVPSAPSLEREIAFPADFPEEGKAIVSRNVDTLKKNIQANANDKMAWLDLALQYKTAGDLEGAMEIWEYLAVAFSDDTVALDNLGTVHHLELKDFKKSESYFKAALEQSATDVLAYSGLHELYRYSYKQDTTAAVDILLEGIAHIKNERALDLLLLLGSYYRDKGDSENARKYYTQVKDWAAKIGDTNLSRSMDAELRTLR